MDKTIKIALIFTAFVLVAGGAFFLGTTRTTKGTTVVTTTGTLSVSPTVGVIETPVPTATSTIAPVTPTVDETEAIKKAVKLALVAEHGATANELTITVSKIEGGYAQGGASAQGGGGMWFAAKVGGVWKLVWDGNGNIYCKNLVSYPNFPKNMIPECYDDVTGKIVVR